MRPIQSLALGLALFGPSLRASAETMPADGPDDSVQEASVWDGTSFDADLDRPVIRPQWRSTSPRPDVRLPDSTADRENEHVQGYVPRRDEPSGTPIQVERPQFHTAAKSLDAPPTNMAAPNAELPESEPDESAKTSPEAAPAPDKAACLSCVPAYQVGAVPYDPTAFIPNPDYDDLSYCAEGEQGVYAGKSLVPTERPWIELGRGLYLPGRLPCSQDFLGDHNLVAQHFLLYGDYRTAVAYVDDGNVDRAVWAHRLNLDWDWKITDTERIHGFWGPLDRGLDFTRVTADHGDLDFVDEFDRNWDTIYFEGDVGSLLGGWCGHDSEFDLPFAAGLVPLLFQNGIWMEDAFVGTAFTFAARNSAKLDWSNFDVTFFSGVDELNSPAFGNDDSAAHVYGVISFIEAYDGYLELGYAYLEDTTGFERSYHNLGVSFTRRYFQRVSNSLRMIVNAGQDPVVGPRTADGCLVLWENALVSSRPNTFVPYANAFAGFGRPQSVARAAVAGGILRNTGILFETDGLTGFPLLDDTGSNSYGGAVGINWLGPQFDYQFIVELATVQTFGRQGGRKAIDDQYGIGARYQLPLNQAWLLRLDAIYGLLENDDNLSGVRAEMRYKF